MSVQRLPPAAWTDLLTDAEGLGHRRPQVLGDRRLTHHVVVAVIVAYVVEDTELNGTEVGSDGREVTTSNGISPRGDAFPS